MSYLGQNINNDVQVNTYSHTATAGQTNFPAAYDTHADVWKNGTKLALNKDYTLNNGTEIVLSSAASIGDIIDINAYFDITYAGSDAIAYNNSTSGLTATNVKGAIDEIDGNVDAVSLLFLGKSKLFVETLIVLLLLKSNLIMT